MSAGIFQGIVAAGTCVAIPVGLFVLVLRYGTNRNEDREYREPFGDVPDVHDLAHKPVDK